MVAVHLHKEAFPIEYVGVARGSAGGSLVIVGKQRSRYRTTPAAGQRNQPGGVFCQCALRQSCVPFFTLSVGMGDQAAHVGVPVLVFGQQSQMATFLRKGELTAYYRFYSGLLRCLREAWYAIKSVVVAER